MLCAGPATRGRGPTAAPCWERPLCHTRAACPWARGQAFLDNLHRVVGFSLWKEKSISLRVQRPVCPPERRTRGVSVVAPPPRPLALSREHPEGPGLTPFGSVGFYRMETRRFKTKHTLLPLPQAHTSSFPDLRVCFSQTRASQTRARAQLGRGGCTSCQHWKGRAFPAKTDALTSWTLCRVRLS